MNSKSSFPVLPLICVLGAIVAGMLYWLWADYKDLQPAPELKHIAVVNDQEGIWGPNGPADTWLVVNFWATWCMPCLAELPILEAFSQAHDANDVRVVGFTRLYQTPEGGDPTQEVRQITAFLQEQKVTFPSLVNTDDRVHFAYGVQNLPTTILINPAGEVVDRGVGIEETIRILDQVEGILRQP